MKNTEAFKDVYDEKNDLMRKIFNGEISLSQVKDRMREMKTKYGPKTFDHEKLPEWVILDKPWNKEYVKKLETLSLVGDTSEEFILHAAEVCDDVLHHKSSSRKQVKSSMDSMEVIQPTCFASACASSKREFSEISKLITKHLGDNVAKKFDASFNDLDFKTANQILTELIYYLTGYRYNLSTLAIYADRFNDTIPELGEELSQALDTEKKIQVIDKYSAQIKKVLNL